MLRRWLLLGVLLYSHALWAMNVVFINPGKSDEVYWLTATRAMSAAATQLGVSLEVLYAERRPVRMLELAQSVIERPPERRPDYVIAVNEGATGGEMLRRFEAAGIRVFLAYSGIADPAEKAEIGAPRTRYRHWLGSLEPHAEDAGYLTAKRLIDIARKKKIKDNEGRIHLLALSGDRTTPTSVRRSSGMRRAVLEAGDVIVDQEVFAAFNREKAAEQAVWLFQRYPSARLVWAGNDLMAFGAIDAWEKAGGKAGVDAWFSGVNTSVEALEGVRSGRLAALSGGHFIAGAWSLILLYDYHHGRDFASDEGLEIDAPMFVVFDARLAERFIERFGKLDFEQVNFRRFSKVLNPAVRRYDFSFQQLLK